MADPSSDAAGFKKILKAYKMSENEIRLPDTSKLIVSSSPHWHGPRNVRKIMLAVIVALLPACFAGIWFFGLRAVWLLGLCAVSCMFFEYLFSRMGRMDSSIRDCSALLTGLLLGMNLSPLAPWWVCVIGSMLAIGLGKMIYGGLGYNPFNPALVGRVALLIAFPGIMTSWIAPQPGDFLGAAVTQATTSATPLGKLAMAPGWSSAKVMIIDGNPISYGDCFLGNIGGCIGETSALALLIGGVFLIALRIIRWQVPLAFIGTVAAWTGAAYLINSSAYAPPQFHILTGGLFLGAFFMATDMVTTPMTALGGIIFGVGCGILTCVIRIWGSYPEGVSFSILFMNALTPLIDRYTGGRPFGAIKEQEDNDT